MTTPIRILILEDRESDAELVLAELRRAGFAPDWQRVETEVDYLAALDPSLDLVLADYHLPKFDGQRALRLLKERGLEMPFILVSGAVGEETAVQMMREGAADYVLKDRMARLGQAVIHALEKNRLRDEKQQARDALRASEHRYQTLAEISPVGIFRTNPLGQTTYVNPRWCEIAGLAAAQAMGDGWLSAVHPEDRGALTAGWQQATQDRIPSVKEYRFLRPDGTLAWVMGQAVPERDDNGEIVGYIGTITDITERVRAEAERQALLEITQGMVTTENLQELLELIHQSLAMVIPAENFFIVLHNKRSGLFEEVFTVDKYDGLMPPSKLERSITSYVFRTGQPLLLTQAKFEELTALGEVELVGTNSAAWLGAPLKTPGETIGVIAVQDYEDEDCYSARDQEFLALVGTQVAMMIERKRGEKALENRAQELQALYQESLEINAQTNLDALLHTIVQRAASLVGVESGGLYLMQADGENLKLVVGHNLPEHFTGITLKVGEGLSGKVAQGGEAMAVEDYQNWDERASIFDDTSLHRVLGVPLKVKGKVIGVINVSDRTHSGIFSEEDIRLVSLFANLAAIAIVNTRLYEQEQARARELSTLYEAARTISSSLSLESVLETVAETMIEILHSDGCTLSLLDRERDALVTQVDIRIKQPDRAESRGAIYYVDKYPASRLVLESGQPVVIHSKDKETDGSELAYMQEKGITTLMMLPLRAHDQVMGLVEIYEEREEERGYTQEEIHLLQNLAAQAAISIENARLFDDAQRHLRQTTALRQIDQAIAGSMNLHWVLETVLNHALGELGVDAAVVLLHDPNQGILKYELGSGFRTEALKYTGLQLGEGYAGQAALTRQTVRIADLRNRTTDFLRSPAFHKEGFVCYFGVPLIAKGEIKGVLELFHRAPLDPDKEWLDFMETLAGQVAIAIDNATLYKDLQRSNAELSIAYDATIEGWSKALDLRDKETEGHTLRVTELTMQMAEEMGISKKQLVHIQRGALLHDIGKMGIPDRILLKPDKLTDEEWDLMRKHPVFAYEMLKPISYLRPALDIPYCHHEKWDGTGYPRGLKGEDIPLVARIFAVVDVYDALTSDRPYRPAWTEDKALEYIKEQSGRYFDPDVVEVFLNQSFRQNLLNRR